MTSPVSNWYHARAKSYYPTCIELFGKPTSISNTRHGFALWKTRGLFSEHILRDENVKHCVPRNHYDYFYSSIKFFIPADKVFNVLKISGSINNDGLKKQITARCGGIGANYATLYLGMMVAMGKMNIDDIQSGEIYPKYISGEMKTHSEMKKEMLQLKKENHNNFKKELGRDFAPYAFTQCYKEQKGSNKTRRNKLIDKDVIKHKLINTRDEDCSVGNKNVCCPHMPPDDKGRYAATNETNILYYGNNMYKLNTCCTMCSDAMNALAQSDPKKFHTKYISRYLSNGDMVVKNQHSKKEVQILEKTN